MALPKWYIEIKAGSNVRDPLGQGWSDDGNVVELQHFSGMHCSGRELWSHPLQGATPSNCEGLRMPAHDDGATPIGAGVRKHRGRCGEAARRTLWGFRRWRVCCRRALTASQEAVEGVADSIGRSRQTESASRQRRLIDKAVVQGGATASMVIAGREPAKTTSGPGLKSTVRGGARPHARKARHFGRRSVAPGTRLLGTGHKPGPVFRQTRKIATIGLNAAFIRGIPAQSAGGDQ